MKLMKNPTWRGSGSRHPRANSIVNITRVNIEEIQNQEEPEDSTPIQGSLNSTIN